MKTILAIDQSTSGTKALLFDGEGQLLGRRDLPHEQKINSQGWVSHDPMEIYRNTLESVRLLLEETGADRESIAAVGISNQRETALLWDRDTGLPVADAVVWQCARAAGVCQRLADRGEASQERTGLNLSPYFPAAKWAWLLENTPGLAGKDLCAGTIDAWLVYKLTGGRVFATDYSNASRTQLFNLRTLSWDEEVCGWFGIGPAMRPEVRFSDSLFGETDFGGLLPHPVPIHGVLGDSHGALMGQEAGVAIQELRVDGGPTKDKFLMQFQSDILNLPVAAPEREELSGMGAAFCAGIAAGVYSKEIFQAVRRSRFLPVMEAALRRKKREGWKQAVETLLTRPGTK